MRSTVAHCIVKSWNSAHVIRRQTVTTFEEVLALHLRYPRQDIAVFEDPTGETGEMWGFWPELELPYRFYR